MRCWALIVLLTGCQDVSGRSGDPGNPSGGDPNNNMMMMGPPPDMTPPPTYPKGPYGNQTGQTLPNLTASGYRLDPKHTDSSKLTWATDIKLQDFNFNPVCKCLLISIGATWCPACQEEQPALVDW